MSFLHVYQKIKYLSLPKTMEKKEIKLFACQGTLIKSTLCQVNPYSCKTPWSGIKLIIQE